MKRSISSFIALVFSVILSSSLTFATDSPIHGSSPTIGKAAPESKSELININTAIEDLLKALSSIGETYYKKIISAG